MSTSPQGDRALPRFTLCPEALARVSLWPTELLDGFGSATKTAQDLPTRDAAYEAAIAADREALWARTWNDPRFAAALALANPTLARALESFAQGRPRNKSVRHMETTLYRYLARAIGRTEPCDAWAAAATARFGTRTRLDVATTRLVFFVDLRPFAALLEQLGADPRHRLRAPHRINGTLTRDDEGAFTLWTREASGGSRRRRLRVSDRIARALQAMHTLGALPLQRLLSRAAEASGVDAASVYAAAEGLIRGGVLVGGLGLPCRFEDPSDALRRAGQHLRGRERRAWERAIRRLDRVCASLDLRLDRLRPAVVVRAHDRAREIVGDLADALGVTFEASGRPILRCDARLCEPVMLERGAGEALTTALGEYHCQSSAFPSAEVRAADRARAAAALGDGCALARAPELALAPAPRTWQELAGDHPRLETEDAITRWEALLAGRETAVRTAIGGDVVDGAPLGAVIAMLATPANTSAAAVTHVRGVSDQVARICARFATRSGRDEAPSVATEIWAWLRARWAAFSRRCGVELAELIAPHPHNPNALVGPVLTNRQIELWSATPGAGDLSDAVLWLPAWRRHPVVGRPRDPRPLVVLSAVSADIGRLDAPSRWLLRTGWGDSPAAGFHASLLPFDSELDVLRYSPRVLLPSGVCVRSRRSVLSGERLAALLAQPRTKRFWSWLSLARELGWPPRVMVHRPGRPGLLVVRDSPLAVEALFEGLEGDRIVVEELPEASGVRDVTGAHHQLELVAPFERTEAELAVLEAV